MILQIVILAMIAAFLGLRLYSVLGRRAEHEEEPVPTRFDPVDTAAPRATLAHARMPQPLRPAGLEGALPAEQAALF